MNRPIPYSPRPSLDLSLSLLATVGILALVTLVAPTQAARQAAWAERQRAQSIQRGAALYELNCRSCHGVNGEGVSELGPALNDAILFQSRLDEVGWVGMLEEYIASTIATGRVTATRPLYVGNGQVVMNAWAQAYGGPLRPDEIKDLTAFVLNWEATALGEVILPTLVAPVSNSQGQAEIGQQVFFEAGCAECHAIQPINPITGNGPELSQIASLAKSRQPDRSAEAYLRQSFLIPNAYIVAGYAPNAGCGGLLSQEQLDHLVAFLLTLR
jgi:mono/diheme cytochrome c family protein